MDDEELTRQAVQELLHDAKKFMAKRNAEFKATQLKAPMKANKVFLSNTIRNVMSYNRNKKDAKVKHDEQTKNSNNSAKHKKQ